MSDRNLTSEEIEELKIYRNKTMEIIDQRCSKISKPEYKDKPLTEKEKYMANILKLLL